MEKVIEILLMCVTSFIGGVFFVAGIGFFIWADTKRMAWVERRKRERRKRTELVGLSVDEMIKWCKSNGYDIEIFSNNRIGTHVHLINPDTEAGIVEGRGKTIYSAVNRAFSKAIEEHKK